MVSKVEIPYKILQKQMRRRPTSKALCICLFPYILRPSQFTHLHILRLSQFTHLHILRLSQVTHLHILRP